MRALCIAAIVFCTSPVFSQFYEIFGPQNVNLCESAGVQYFIETSEQIARTDWTITPPGTANVFGFSLTSAAVQFFAPGIYILVATSTTNNNQIFSDSITIFVYGALLTPEILGCYELSSDSITNCYRVCAFSQTVISFPGGSPTINFQVTGAESYTLNDFGELEITWGPGGSGIVNFYNQGCDLYLCFDILPQPVADFTTTPLTLDDTITVCKDQDIYFENASQNGIVYTWNFGDGEVSYEYDVTHSYADEGYYTVTLSANSICECADEKQIVVNVLPAPAPTLDCVNSVCPESRQRYTATTTGCTNFLWSVSSNGTIVNGGGPTDDFIEVIWHEGPDGFIDLEVSGCAVTYCSFTNRFRIPIISPEGPIEGDASVCSGELTTYTAPYFPGTQYQWQIGPFGVILGEQNRNAITVQWDDVNAAASSFVEVVYDNCFLECGGMDRLNVMITPEISLIGDMQVCEGDMAMVQAQAGFGAPSPVNVMWELLDASGQVIATAGPASTWNHAFTYPAGLYTWVARNVSPAYCTEIASLEIQVSAVPDAPLGIKGETDICPGIPYGYTIESAGNFNTLWTITDGSNTAVYTGNTCQHTFGPTPPYIVSAIHADIQYAACASPPISVVLGSAVNLVISGPDEVCFNAIDSFSAMLISGAEFSWEVIPSDHGEIRNSNLNTVEVFWTQSGPVTLRLNVCGVMIDKVIQIRPLPAYNLSGPLAACANETVWITTDQPTLPHTWRNESGAVISLTNSTSLFPGSYAVALTDLNGCVGEKPFQITSYPTPSVHLSTAASLFHCVTLPGGVDIVANTDGAGYTFEWFLNGISIGLSGPVWNVTAFGTYHVAVTNQYGCTTTSSPITFINCCPPDICGAGVPGSFPGCTFLSHNFTISATEIECHVHRYESLIGGITPGSTWWFIESASEGLITAANTDVLQYTYDRPGYYTLTMLGLLDGFPYTAVLCGHFEGLTDEIKAVADFKHEGICAAAAISFEDLTTFLPGESIASWLWNFDDPSSGAANTSFLQDPTHVFSAAGTYDVSLTVTLASGCTTTKNATVHISGGPVLSPVYVPLHCEDEAMAFQLPGDVFDIDWEFGDPASGVENSAVSDSVFHSFDLPGTYLVTVAASDIYECRSQATFMVDIVQNTLDGLIDVNPMTSLCEGDSAVLTAPGGVISWNWSTGDTVQQIVVGESNQYHVLIRDQYQCTYSPPPVFVEVLPRPVVTIKAREIYGVDMYGPWTSSLSICYGTEFELQAFSTGNVLYQWSHGVFGQILQFTLEGGNLPPAGIHEFTVTTTDLITLCPSDSFTIVVEIFELPVIPIISLTSGPACSFNDNVLQVTNPQADVTYEWSDGQTGLSITVTEAGAYAVTAINEHGCTTEGAPVFINPAPLVDQIPGGCFIECDPLDVCLPPLLGVASYTIFQNGIPYMSGAGWPTDFQITNDGSYTIEVTAFNGCTAVSDPLDVLLYPGVGSITVETWLDQDGDGVISAGDVLISGIPVIIQSDDGMQEGATETVPGGQFIFEDYPAAEYLVMIDRSLLSSMYRVVIDSIQGQIVTCDDSIVIALLITENCIALGPDQVFEMCPGDMLTVGDSTWTDTGMFVIHMLSIGGCDSVFNVIITTPDSLEITGQVWVDVDHDGMISAADTLISGIIVSLAHTGTGATDVLVTDMSGGIQGDFLSGEYRVILDTAMLPVNYIPILFETMISDTSCGSAAFAFLIESACPVVFVSQQVEMCPGDSVLIEGQWVTNPGVYNFIITDPGTYCDTILDVTVSLTEAMEITAIVDWDCIWLGSVHIGLTGAGPFTIDWGPWIQGDTLVTGLPEGDYHVTLTDANGCVINNMYTIVPSPPLQFHVPALYKLTEGDSVLITITGDVNEPGLSYIWSPAGILSCPTCPATEAFPEHDTLVTIIITDSDSCTYELQTQILVTAIDQLYVPNVFTPNDDGINDYWTLYSRLPNTYVHELSLFDRWGTQVFHKTEFDLITFEGWDGTFKGKHFNPGVFVYMAELTLGDGQKVRVKGDVTLIR